MIDFNFKSIIIFSALGWIDVTWDHGGSNSYRMGAEGKYDLRLSIMSESDPNSVPVSASKPVLSVTGKIYISALSLFM